MIIVMDKTELLDKLGERLKAAKAEDIRAKKQHEIDEQNTLKRFREAIRLALSWDYRRAKKENFCAGIEKYPSCPKSDAGLIQRSIQLVSLDNQKTQRIDSERSTIAEALLWLPPEDRPKKSLCD